MPRFLPFALVAPALLVSAPAWAVPEGVVGAVSKHEGAPAVRVDVADGSCLVSVGTLVGRVQAPSPGDVVVFLDAGFTPGARPAPRPAQPPKPSRRADPPERPTGRVASVRDGLVLLDIGSKSGLSVGHRVAIYDAKGRQVARMRIGLIGPNSAGGFLETGNAEKGLRARSLGPGTKDAIDFVALDFLGVVADLEHPKPHRAPCHVGVPVRRVLPGSPAQKAGLGRGDRVIAVDGTVVRDIASVRSRIEAREGDVVRVAAIRGDRLLLVDVDFRREE
jgi:membrane-associated protease RseP (regulator of RpoE activity)